MSLANLESFTSSFPIQMPFISLSYFIAGAKISNTMLMRSGENEHPYLVPKTNTTIRKKTGKYTNTRRLNNILLNSEWVINEIK